MTDVQPNAEVSEPAKPSIGDTAVPGQIAPRPVKPSTVKADAKAGHVVVGTVTAISKDEVDLTLEDGRPAVIRRENFDAHGTDPMTVLTIGDGVEGAVLAREDPKGRVVLSRTWALKRKAWETLANAHASGESITAKVTSASKKGLVIDAGVRGFAPAAHVELEPSGDLSKFVGEVFEWRVLEANPSKDRLLLSRRSILMREDRKKAHERLASLKVGEVVSGKVVSIAPYGVFVDIGGLNGLVHVSELSWDRLRSPGAAVKVGQDVEAKVVEVKVRKRRVGLSIRQLQPDPLTQLPVGEVVVGTVVRLVDFGAFIDIGGGVEGLAHLSELAEFRVTAPEEVVMPGEELRVKILGVDKKRRRIELSVRQAVSYDFG
jgi:small subunit ribosomal protein S1